jgi:hypothetical protein
VTFTLDGQMTLHKTFSKWLHAIINLDEYSLSYKKDIVRDQEIYQLDKNNISTYGMRLIDAYPIMVSPIDLANTGANEVQRFNVSFVFDRFDLLS